MNSNRNNKKTSIKVDNNLIGHDFHRYILNFQANVGIAKNGGSVYNLNHQEHLKRLVNDVNILSTTESIRVALSEPFFKN